MQINCSLNLKPKGQSLFAFMFGLISPPESGTEGLHVFKMMEKEK